MEKVQLILEFSKQLSERDERRLAAFCTLKYRLPLIGMYVVEVDKQNVRKLSGLPGVTMLHNNTGITAQRVRRASGAEGLTGRGISIAFLDTGISAVDDFIMPKNRILAFRDFVGGKGECYDDNAHGTHVAGIAAGNGANSGGKYCGIAPEAGIVSVKILDHDGKGNAVDVLAGIQWVVDNKDLYNIRVLNLSIGAPDNGSRDPLVRAVEAAWDLGIVVCIAAGNNGPKPGSITSPGISRKAITVGASDDSNSVTIWGNALQNFSGRGPTSECIHKPDVLAPGSNIISCLTRTPNLTDEEIKDKCVNEHYVSMSGTSMATPVISGAIALLLQKHPELTPNDVKLLLKKTSQDLRYPQNQQGWGQVDVMHLLLRATE